MLGKTYVVLSAVCVIEIVAHGMMMEPPNRSSLWRMRSKFPGAEPNYEDNQNFCGGMSVQWNTFGGKCGVCGDRFDRPHPQNNENTGRYGKVGVVRNYRSGATIPISIRLTANHRGYFKYSLCKLDNHNAPESGEDCFQPLYLADGRSDYKISAGQRFIKNSVVLPKGLTCARCVLRWHYTAGNNWGRCDDGTHKVGCGPQETFRSCADISISS